MEPPRYVYKYQSPDSRHILSLAKRAFWCSHPSKFNDPFDCAGSLLWRRPRDVISEVYLDAILNSDIEQLMEHAIEIVVAEAQCADKDGFSPADTFIKNRLAKCNGVVCFSELRNHLLMWGHYARSHAGFCLEFDTSFQPFKDKLRQVIYQTKLPRHEASVKELGSRVDVTSFLLVKAKEWKYEKEWRLLCEGFDELVEYPPEALTAIYFGAKVSQDTLQQVTSVVNPATTRLMQMKLAQDKFKLVEVDL